MRIRVLQFLALLLSMNAAPLAGQNAEDLYQQALVRERAAGDLEKAIELFQRAARAAGNNRELGAKALIGAARSYEKLGQSKSRELYEEVVRSYSDQKSQAAIARERVVALSDATSLGPPPGLPSWKSITELNIELGSLRQLEANLGRTFTAQYPQRVQLRRQISATEEALQAEQDRLNEFMPGIRAAFDTTKPIAFRGTIKDVQWVNPNVYIDVEVEVDQQRMMYRVRGANPKSLTERGVTPKLFRVGDLVTVSGFPLIPPADGTIRQQTGPLWLPPTPVGIAIVVLPDGTEVFLGRSLMP